MTDRVPESPPIDFEQYTVTVDTSRKDDGSGELTRTVAHNLKVAGYVFVGVVSESKSYVQVGARDEAEGVWVVARAVAGIRGQLGARKFALAMMLAGYLAGPDRPADPAPGETPNG